MNTHRSHSHPRRLLFALSVLLITLLCLTLSAHAENIYVGRQNGEVVWSMDKDTGELRIYADDRSGAPTWQGLAPNVRSIYIAPGVTMLPSNAFFGCSAVKEIFLPDSLRSVGAYAFADCAALSSLSLPGELSDIGAYAFRGCTLLRSVIFRGRSEQWERLQASALSSLGNEVLADLTPTYTLPTCTLTVHFVDAESGQVLADSIRRTATQGSPCTVPCPAIEFFSPEQSQVRVDALVRDQTVTVAYRRTHAKITVHYVDEKGSPLLDPQILTVALGAQVTLQPPDVIGYLPRTQEQVTLKPLTQDENAYTFVYRRIDLSVKVHCISEQGLPLCDPIVISDIPYGGAFYVALPIFEGYVAEKHSLEGERVTQSIEQTVTYTRRQVSVTLYYLDEQGKTLSPPDTLQLPYGTPLSHLPKAIDGYAPIEPSISIASLTETQSRNVVYRPARFLLTVRHESDDGTLLDQTNQTLSFGQSFRCQPLSIEGYRVRQDSLDSAVGTMPAEPLTVTLMYQKASTGASLPQDGSPSLPALLWVAVIVVLAVAFALGLVLGRRKKKEAMAVPSDIDE